MPRPKNGVGRRYKKRRTSPASAIEVEQIEEEGVEELVVVEGETEEVAEIAIVEFGEDVVMWVLDHVFEKVWAERDWQAYRFVRYATMSSVVVREWKREGGVEGIGPHWWAVRKMWDEFRLAGWEKEYTACAPFSQWERLRCSDCWGTASVCECTRECACGNVSKWSWGFIGGLCACADAPGVRANPKPHFVSDQHRKPRMVVLPREFVRRRSRGCSALRRVWMDVFAVLTLASVSTRRSP